MNFPRAAMKQRQNPTAIVSPVIDSIEADTLEYRQIRANARGGRNILLLPHMMCAVFSWSLHFFWRSLDRYDETSGQPFACVHRAPARSDVVQHVHDCRRTVWRGSRVVPRARRVRPGHGHLGRRELW